MKHTHDVLITGGFGFIGYHLAKRLLERTQKNIVVIGRSEPDVEARELMQRFPERLTFLSMDLRDMDENTCPDVTEVYHLAARKVTTASIAPGDTLDENLETDAAVFYAFAAREDLKLVYASSLEVLGPLWEMLKGVSVEWPLKEGSALAAVSVSDPQWLYGLSKIAGEMRLRHGSFLFDWSIARLQNPYGPRMGDATLLPVAMKNAMTGVATKVFMEDTRPFLYIDDVVEALMLMMESSHTSRRTLAVCGEERSVPAIVRMIYSIQGLVPALIEMHRGDLAPNMVRAMETTALAELGWRPWVTIEEGLRKTWDYYRIKFTHHESQG